MWERLKDLSREQQVSEYVTMLTGFQTLLHRYDQQEETSIGLPLADERQTEFVLSLACNLSDNPTFRELLGSMDRQTSAVISSRGKNQGSSIPAAESETSKAFVFEDASPVLFHRVGRNARVDHRPAIAIAQDPDVDVIEPPAHGHPNPEHAVREFRNLARPGNPILESIRKRVETAL